MPPMGGPALHISEVQDTRFQEREWTVQRVGWVLLVAFVVAALLGFLGPGPLSHSQAESTNGTIHAEYYRFVRLGGAGTVTVTVAPSAIGPDSMDVWWNGSYLDETKVEGVTPEPDTVTAIGGRVRYTFAAESSDRPVVVTFDLTPDGMGSKSAEVAVGDGAEHLTFDQFVYP
jgi:hypothetical protein